MDHPRPQQEPPQAMASINLDRTPTGQSVPYSKLILAIGPLFGLLVPFLQAMGVTWAWDMMGTGGPKRKMGFEN